MLMLMKLTIGQIKRINLEMEVKEVFPKDLVKHIEAPIINELY